MCLTTSQFVAAQVGMQQILGFLTAPGLQRSSPITQIERTHSDSKLLLASVPQRLEQLVIPDPIPANTAEEWKSYYTIQPWGQRFRDLRLIDAEIDALRGNVTTDVTPDHLRRSISFYEQLIVDAERDLNDLRRKAGNWSVFGLDPFNISENYDAAARQAEANLATLKGNRAEAVQMLENLERLDALSHQRQGLIETMDVVLSDGTVRQAGDIDGSLPAQGLDNFRGKPGQFPLSAPVTSTTDGRDPGLYGVVINQFAVGDNVRYQQDNYTYCNTFAGDVMRAMDAPLPTKAEVGGRPNDPATLAAAPLYNWLVNSGSERGWREIDPSRPEDLKLLVDHVNAGKPALISSSEHVAVVRPNQGEVTKVGDLKLAQAGAINTNNVLRKDIGFGTTPKYFVHD